LAYLSSHAGGINRFEADRDLNIVHVAARVQDLEALGCKFHTIRERAADPLGAIHTGIARYWLLGAPIKLLKAATERGGFA
jgi:hypothetical protein